MTGGFPFTLGHSISLPLSYFLSPQILQCIILHRNSHATAVCHLTQTLSISHTHFHCLSHPISSYHMLFSSSPFPPHLDCCAQFFYHIYGAYVSADRTKTLYDSLQISSDLFSTHIELSDLLFHAFTMLFLRKQLPRLLPSSHLFCFSLLDLFRSLSFCFVIVGAVELLPWA